MWGLSFSAAATQRKKTVLSLRSSLPPLATSFPMGGYKSRGGLPLSPESVRVPSRRIGKREVKLPGNNSDDTRHFPCRVSDLKKSYMPLG